MVPTASKQAPARERIYGLALAGIGVAGLLVGCLTLYFAWPLVDSRLAHDAMTPAVAALPTAPPEPANHYPVENIQGASKPPPYFRRVPLPALDDSDFTANDSIEAILGNGAFTRLLVPHSLVRHIVATVDSLPRKELVESVRPIKPVPGLPVVDIGAHGMSIAHANADRYASYVAAAESIDTERLVQSYIRLYPLFQQAYVELGYPDGYFNDRLVTVIDHLLAAPDALAPVEVWQPHILYQYVDPDLEELSAGQKILVRVGLDNEHRLKAVLRKIRSALTTVERDQPETLSSDLR
jgi:hypothetical protein